MSTLTSSAAICWQSAALPPFPHINNFPPPQAIQSLTLRLDDLTGETGKQLLLGERRHLQLQLEEAICQLKARYGYSPVYRCVDVEPWSVIPEERQILVESDG